MKIKAPPGKPLPPQFKELMQVEFHREFTRKERLQILCGYTADIKMGVACQHNPGAIAPKMDITLTPALRKKPSFWSRLFKRHATNPKP